MKRFSIATICDGNHVALQSAGGRTGGLAHSVQRVVYRFVYVVKGGHARTARVHPGRFGPLTGLSKGNKASLDDMTPMIGSGSGRDPAPDVCEDGLQKADRRSGRPVSVAG
jgi:hypothetical protein